MEDKLRNPPLDAWNMESIVSTICGLCTNTTCSQSDNKYGCCLNMRCPPQPRVLGEGGGAVHVQCGSYGTFRRENLTGLEMSHLGIGWWSLLWP